MKMNCYLVENLRSNDQQCMSFYIFPFHGFHYGFLYDRRRTFRPIKSGDGTFLLILPSPVEMKKMQNESLILLHVVTQLLKKTCDFMSLMLEVMTESL